MSPIPADSLMVAPTAHTAPQHPLAELNSNCVADALRVDSLSMVPAQQRLQLQRNSSFLDVEELRAVCCRSGRSAFLDPAEEDCLVSVGCGGVSGALLFGQGVACGVGTVCAGPLGKLPQMLAAAALPPPLVTTGAFGEEQVEEPEPSESDTSCCFEKAWYCLQQVEQEDDEEQSSVSCHSAAIAAQSQRMVTVLPATDAPVSLAKSAVAARAALGVPARRKSPSPAASLLVVLPAAEAVPAGADDAHATIVAQPAPAPAKAFHHKSGGPCDHCGAKESPQWRRGPAAKPTLCNACGTRYRRTNQLGVPGMKAANANKGAAASANKRSPKRTGASAERPAKRQNKPTAAAGVAATPEVSASVVMVEVAQAVELC